MDAFRRLAQVAGQDPVLASDYLRVSNYQGGRSASNPEQHQDHEVTCEENSWLMGKSYEDQVSASRYGRKARADFADLLADLEHDRFDAHVLMLWESSRGTRKVGEMVTLIELCEARKKFIWVQTHGRLYDPSNYRDRKTLLEDAIKNEADSAETSGRVTRTFSRTAREGRPHGRAGYGFRREYDPKTGKLVCQVVDPEESKVGAELYRRLDRGESIRAIHLDWKARGIRTRSGRVWSEAHIRTFAMCPSNAGLRAHRPVRPGAPASGSGSEPRLYEAQWEGFVDPAVWRRVTGMLRSEDRKTFRPGRGKHLLSMIARCGVCGGPLSVGYRKNAEYACDQGGCVRINKDDLDEYALAKLLAWLADESVIEKLRAVGQAEDDTLAGLRDELEQVRARHSELARSVRAGKTSMMLAEQIEPGLLKDMATLRRQITEREVPSVLGCLIEPGKEVRERWAEAPMSAKRTAARALLCPQWFGELRVHRSPRRGRSRVPAEQRVRFFRRLRSTPPPAEPSPAAA